MPALIAKVLEGRAAVRPVTPVEVIAAPAVKATPLPPVYDTVARPLKTMFTVDAENITVKRHARGDTIAVVAVVVVIVVLLLFSQDAHHCKHTNGGVMY